MAKAKKSIPIVDATRNVPRGLSVPALTDDAYEILAAYREMVTAEAAIEAEFDKNARKFAAGGKASKRVHAAHWSKIDVLREAYAEKARQTVERITRGGHVVNDAADILTLALIELLGRSPNARARGPLAISLLGAAGVQVLLRSPDAEWVKLPKRNER